MKIIPQTNLFFVNYSPNFASKNSENDKITPKYASKSIDKILSTPIEKRSAHLLHEKSPKTGMIVQSRFKTTAGDGMEITVYRSFSKGNFENIKYLGMIFDDGKTKRTVRIDIENGRVIKSGLDAMHQNHERVMYYSRNELEKIGIQQLLDLYVPEILKFVPGRNMPETIKPASAEKQVVQKEKLYSGRDLVKKIPREKRENFSTTIQRCSRKYLKMPEKCHADLEQDIQNDLCDIEAVYDRYKRYLKSFSTYHKKSNTNQMYFDDVLKRFAGQKAIILKDFDGDNYAKILRQTDYITRIAVFDNNKMLLRSYAVKNHNKLLSNLKEGFSYQPHIKPKYYSEYEFKQIKPKFYEDVKKIKEKMKTLDCIMDSLNFS